MEIIIKYILEVKFCLNINLRFNIVNLLFQLKTN